MARPSTSNATSEDAGCGSGYWLIRSSRTLAQRQFTYPYSTVCGSLVWLQAAVPAELAVSLELQGVELRRSSPYFTLLRTHAALASHDTTWEPRFARACTGDEATGSRYAHPCVNTQPTGGPWPAQPDISLGTAKVASEEQVIYKWCTAAQSGPHTSVLCIVC